MKRSLQSSKIVDVSVIIVSFNTKKLTLQCIKSVIKTIKNISYEIIVVDNASTDSSVADIRNFQFPISNFQLKLIENKKNLGFAKANNQALEIAKGKYILLLNSDTEVQKGSIEKLVKFAKSKKSMGVTVPQLLNPNRSIQASVFRLPTILLAIKQYWLGQKEVFEKYAPAETGPVEVESAVMAAFLITPQALKKVGYLDERYFMYFEDIDYCRRIKEVGLKVYYLPMAGVIHYHGASSKVSDNNQNEILIQSSRVYHGNLRYNVITAIIWLGQKYSKLFNKKI